MNNYISVEVFIENDISGDWGKEFPDEKHKTKVFCVRGADINDLNIEFTKNASYKNSKLLTTAKIDDDMLASILQNSVGKDSQLLGGSFKLVGNGIEAKLPVKLGLWNTQISTKIRVLGANNKVELILEDAKIGKVPIPGFALEKYLKEVLTGTGVSINGNTITIKSLGLPLKVEGIETVGGKITVTASLNNAQLLAYR